MSYTRSFIGESEFDRQALNLDPGQSGVPLWKVYDPRSEGMPSDLRYDLSGVSRYTRHISSRLGRYERQRFGGLGAASSSGWPLLSPEEDFESYLEGGGSMPSGAVSSVATGKVYSSGAALDIAEPADSGTDWGSVFGTVFDILGSVAKPIVGVVMGEREKKRREKERKREEYRLAMEASLYGGQSGSSTPSKSRGGGKTALFIGLGVVALASVIGVIVYVSR